MDLITGLIIKTIPYQDNAKIVYVLGENGKESFVLKGATTLKSKAYSYGRELSLISYSLSRNYFKAGKVEKVYPKIKNSGKLLSISMAILEMIDILAQHVKDTKTFYKFSLETLDLLENSFNPDLVLLIYKLKNLYLFGIEPSFRRCSECGSEDNLLGFTSLSGGMLCSDCSDSFTSFEKEENVNLLKYLYYTKMDKIDFNLISTENQELINNSNKIVTIFYEEFLGFFSKTEKITKAITKQRLL